MALSKQKYHQVGTPRVYCDLVQYLKAIGKRSLRYSRWEGDEDLEGSQIGSVGWDMNPVRVRTGIIGDRPNLREFIFFGEGEGEELFDWASDEEWLDIDLRNILNNVTYYGVLGHNLSSVSDDGGFSVSINNFVAGSDVDTTTLVGEGYDGTYLATINETLYSTPAFNVNFADAGPAYSK